MVRTNDIEVDVGGEEGAFPPFTPAETDSKAEMLAGSAPSLATGWRALNVRLLSLVRICYISPTLYPSTGVWGEDSLLEQRTCSEAQSGLSQGSDKGLGYWDSECM